MKNQIKHVHRKGIHPYNIGHKHREGIPIDFYAYASKIRGWNTTFKVVFSVLVLLLCIVLNNPYVSVTVIIAMAYLTCVKGGLLVRSYLSVLSIPLAFILISSITIAIDFSKQPMGQYHLYLGFGYVFTSQVRLKLMANLILKVLAALSALQMLTLSTPSTEIISVLRRAHVPKLIVELMNLIYRFIFIIMEVYTKMKNSAEARMGYGDFRTSCYTFGSIAGNMLVLSMKKANAYYDAMESRCYEGELNFFEEDRELRKIQLVAATVYLIFLLLLWGFTR